MREILSFYFINIFISRPDTGKKLPVYINLPIDRLANPPIKDAKFKLQEN